MKHERAGLILLSYVIGFTTAFIAYGLHVEIVTTMPFLTESYTSTQTATVAEARPELSPVTDARAYESETGLVFARGGEERLVAARAAYFPDLGDDAYVSLESYALDTTDSYLFFCMTTPSVSDSCFPYVYDWVADGLRPVTVGGERGNLALGNLTAVWSSDGYLEVGRLSSISPETPWALK